MITINNLSTISNFASPPSTPCFPFALIRGAGFTVTRSFPKFFLLFNYTYLFFLPFTFTIPCSTTIFTFYRQYIAIIFVFT